MTLDARFLKGHRFELSPESAAYPEDLRLISHPPKRLYGIGDPSVLRSGLAVVGARKATPYGRSAADRFARLAARRGVPVISGGARGCDAAAHEAALKEGGPTVVFFGGGCDEPYPKENMGLFQRVIDGGGAVVSEHDWTFRPLPYTFRARNRLIAGLARATLIVEAGLPSGTFSTADEALEAGREVWVVPGSITSASSRGANRLLQQGALPIVDDDSFLDALGATFGDLIYGERLMAGEGVSAAESSSGHPLLEEAVARTVYAAMQAEPLGLESLRDLAASGHQTGDALTWLMVWLVKAQRAGLIEQHPDGRYCAAFQREDSRAIAG